MKAGLACVLWSLPGCAPREREGAGGQPCLVCFGVCLDVHCTNNRSPSLLLPWGVPFSYHDKPHKQAIPRATTLSSNVYGVPTSRLLLPLLTDGIFMASRCECEGQLGFSALCAGAVECVGSYVWCGTMARSRRLLGSRGQQLSQVEEAMTEQACMAC
eukprot:1158246-Pelagomonas_calceolata.AAC.6